MMPRTTTAGPFGPITEQAAPYPRGPVEHNPGNDSVVSAAPDEPSNHEKEAARIAEVKRIAGSP